MNALFDLNNPLPVLLFKLNGPDYTGAGIKTLFSDYMAERGIVFSEAQKDRLINTRNPKDMGTFEYISAASTPEDWQTVMADHFSHALIQSRNFLDTILDPAIDDRFRLGCIQALAQSKIILSQNVSNYRVYFAPEKGDPLDEFLQRVSEEIVAPLQKFNFPHMEHRDFDVDAPIRHFMEGMTEHNWELLRHNHDPYSEYGGPAP